MSTLSFSLARPWLQKKFFHKVGGIGEALRFISMSLLIVQLFRKVPPCKQLATTQSEPPPPIPLPGAVLSLRRGSSHGDQFRPTRIVHAHLSAQGRLHSCVARIVDKSPPPLSFEGKAMGVL